jgi:CheY-like chemotaxis protein
MRAAGWQVDTAINGLDGIAAAAAIEPDVIVMDIAMPVLDGIAATHRLKHDPRTAHIPVVACTAFGDDHRDDLQEAGFDGLVSKPCEAEELRAVVEKVVAEHTPRG